MNILTEPVTLAAKRALLVISLILMVLFGFPGPDPAFGQDTIGTDASTQSSLSGSGAPSATIRINNLACLEAVVNIGANGLEIVFVLVGICLLGGTIKAEHGKKRIRRVVIGTVLIAIGISLAPILNWLWASAANADLFS